MLATIASWQIALAAAIVSAAILWMLPRRLPDLIILGVALLVGGTTWAGVRELRKPPPQEVVTQRPVEVEAAGYTSSDACQSCHPDQYGSWVDSYHRTMTQVVTPETLATELDGVELESDGIHYRFEREGDAYFAVRTQPGPGGRPVSERFPVTMSTGSHHMQIYWLATGPDRRLEIVPFHYLIGDDRWVPRRASFVTPPGRNVFGTDWNTGCILCHATKGQPRIEAGTVDSQAAEFGIACEACHGAGEEHVLANRNPQRRYEKHLADDAADPTIVNPARLTKERSSEVCGRCHGYAAATPEARKTLAWSGYDFEPGDDLSKSRKILQKEDIAVLERAGYKDGRLWPDGVIRGSGREFGGIQISPCFERGEMSCLSCHEMHPGTDDPRSRKEWANDQLRHDAVGNGACVSCHPAIGADVAAHTHHPAESAGSVCYNCHMPHTTLGLMGAIRVHQVISPSAASVIETGRPGGCTLCHMDQPLGWTAEHLEAWYGQPQPELDESQRTISAAVDMVLTGDAGQRAIVAWSMGWSPAQEASGTDWMPPYLGQLLVDPYPVVRYIAHKSLSSIPGYDAIEYDFVAEEGPREASRIRVREQWSARLLDRGSAPAAAVLLDSEGALSEEVFARLLADRDDTPVVVVE